MSVGLQFEFHFHVTHGGNHTRLSEITPRKEVRRSVLSLPANTPPESSEQDSQASPLLVYQYVNH